MGKDLQRMIVSILLHVFSNEYKNRTQQIVIALQHMISIVYRLSWLPMKGRYLSTQNTHLLTHWLTLSACLT